LIPPDKKRLLVRYIQEAIVDGARARKACEVVCISYRSFLRWKSGKIEDARKGAAKHNPRKLSKKEQDAFYSLATDQRFRDMTPAQIVATLLDEGVYHASESTLYRIFRERKANIRRSETRTPRTHTPPPGLIATGPNQVWTWDITWLKTDVKGLFLYGYVIIDLYSRKIVGWTIKDTEDPEHARDLFNRTIICEGTAPKFVHADNGGPMRGITLRVFLNNLNVELSYNRPRVSNDNPYSESWFGTMKNHVTYPKFFSGIQVAMEWFAGFVHSYNAIHRHSGIGYVTPVQRHIGEDKSILRQRRQVLRLAAKKSPERFVHGPRALQHVSEVYLNCRPPNAA